MQYLSKKLDLNLTFDRKTDKADNIIRYIDSNFYKLKTDWKLIRVYIYMLVENEISYLS